MKQILTFITFQEFKQILILANLSRGELHFRLF
jgi:hypothetical protein